MQRIVLVADALWPAHILFLARASIVAYRIEYVAVIVKYRLIISQYRKLNSNCYPPLSKAKETIVTKEFATGASIQWQDFDQTDTIVSGLTLTSVGHWFESSGSKDHQHLWYTPCLLNCTPRFRRININFKQLIINNAFITCQNITTLHNTT